jgi:RNA polymerase sigma-70 factor (ECF subfamily)
MEEQDIQNRLSRINTLWTMLFQAQGKPQAPEVRETELAGSTELANRPQSPADSGAVRAAQQALLQRYCGAVYRYLLAAVRDANVADELSQEFALAFLRGDFKRADPGRGRFRDYVKTVLFHLVSTYHRKQQKLPRAMPAEFPEPSAEEPDTLPSDQEFIDRWREQLLARSWEALGEVERKTGQLYHTVLRFRAKNPGVQSAQMAERLGAHLGRPFTAAGIRQTLHRARDKFADLLLDEVICSLETSDPDQVEQELIDLGLLSYCQDALRKRAGK